MIKTFTRRVALLVSGLGLSLAAGAQQYCTPTQGGASCQNLLVIKDFSTTGGTINISNNGNNCSNGFQSGKVHTSVPGSTVGLSLTTAFGNQKIWVDWNGDKDFTDAGEEVFTFYGTTSNGSFLIPANATLGTTRMRVRYTAQDYYNTGFTPCDYQVYSEYEDYDFVVTAPCTPPTLSTVVTNVSCFNGNNGAINLTASGSGSYTYDWGNGITTEDRTGLAAGTYSVTVSEVGNTTCQATTSATVNQPATAVGGSTVVTNVSCFGGSNGAINLTPTGGTAPYTFDWGGGITFEDRVGLGAGTYSVTITDDNGCTGVVSATVTQPAAALGTTTVVTNVACFGGNSGTINLTPYGGTSPYTYNWGSGINTEDRTNLVAGTYGVTITDNKGCQHTVFPINVSQPSSPVSANASINNVSCFNGSNGTINLTPYGGIGGYSYQWSDGATTEDRTGLKAGNYTVTITDANGCTSYSPSYVITQPSAIVTTGTQTNPTCSSINDGTATVSVSGGSGVYSYYWYPSGGNAATASNLAPGNYIAFVFDNNGCSSSKSFTMTAGAATATPTVSVTAPANAICYGAPATFTATGTNLNGGAYAWSRNGVIIPNEVGTTLTLTDISKNKLDTIAVSVTGITGCVTATSVTSANVTAQAVGTPNPAIAASGTKNLCDGQSVTLSNNVNAGNAYSFSWKDAANNEVATTYDYTANTAGTYTLTITDGNNCVRTSTPQVVIVKPTPTVNASANGDLAVCAGNSVTLSNSVSDAGVTYRWKRDGVTNVSTTSSYVAKTAGSYTLTATQSGCSAVSAPFDVTVRNTDVSLTTFGTTELCPGYSITLFAAYSADYTYQWYNGNTPIAYQTNNGINITTSGNYKVMISNGGCPAKSSVVTKVTATTLPAATITQMSSSASSVVLRGNNGTVYGYQWYLDGNAIPNATSQIYTANVNGSYTLELSRNGCTVMSSPKVIGSITAPGSFKLAEEVAQATISVYPNPSEGVFNIASQDAVNVIVRDVQGRVIVNLTNAAQVDLTNQAAGIYLMQIMDTKGNLLQSERLIKK